MTHDELNRRKFHRLTAAAFSGLVAGASWGCRSESEPASDPAPPAGGAGEESQPAANNSETGAETVAVAAADLHICRGLNTCQGKGAGGENACRGQGQCATVEHSSCGGQNACKGLGGCGEEAGYNACKGKGGCQVPLMEDVWKSVRTRKEGDWTAAKEKYGAAPAAEKKAKSE